MSLPGLKLFPSISDKGSREKLMNPLENIGLIYPDYIDNSFIAI